MPSYDSFMCPNCEGHFRVIWPEPLPSLSIPKMLSGANAFEISDIQEERNREPGPNKGQNITM